MQEGKTAIKIRSEHVVRMLDVGVVDGRAYLVMEYLDGEDLEAPLRKKGPIAATEAINLLLQACKALGEAHALGIVHRDLKPANLFLTHRPDGSPCVKVLDFGISKMPRAVSGILATGSHPTLPSLVMGSPQYMSPEQMASAAAAERPADIWSLGAILYELVSGRVAFDGATTAEICARVLMGEPTPLADLRNDLPPEIALVISRCLNRDLSRRYANVSELASALAPFGTASARASAASLERIVEGTIAEVSPDPSSVRSSPRSGVGTMKPTAAEILAAVPARHRSRTGYLAASLLVLVAAAIAVGALPSRWNRPAAAAVAASSPPVLPPSPVPALAAHDAGANHAR